MPQSLWADTQDFFANLTPEFVFLLCLPFFVAGISFIPDLWRRWRTHRDRQPVEKVASPASPPPHRKPLASSPSQKV